jgi:transcriptional regulator with XRE-family HTH domain
LQPLDKERVKEWRGRRMLSQQEVADRAGTSLFTIQRIERGEGNVRPKTGRGVAAALGVPIEELLPKVQAPLFRELPESALEEERRSGLMPWVDYTRQIAGRIQGHADDPDSPAFRDAWAAFFYLEEVNRNAAHLSMFLEEQSIAALELADVEAMDELMDAFEELGRAIGAASARARLMKAERTHSELGQARKRAEEAAAEREIAAAGLSAHLGRSA